MKGEKYYGKTKKSLKIYSCVFFLLAVFSICSLINTIGFEEIDLSGTGVSRELVIGLSIAFATISVLIDLFLGITGTLGIIVTFILNLLINAIINLVAHIQNIASMPLISALILILISAVLTLLAGSIPAKMASQKDPVESLRGE